MALYHVLVVLALAAQAFSLPSYGYAAATSAKLAVRAPPPPAKLAVKAEAPVEDASSESAEEELPPRDYKFNYAINDEIVGMSHSRAESQKDGVITGEYKYTRPDGVLVSVRYTADEEGFHPEIKEEASPALGGSGKATHSMDLPDVAETIYVAITEEEIKKKEEQTYAAPEYAAAADYYPTTKAYAYEAPTTTTTTTTTSTTQKPYEAPTKKTYAAPVKQAYY